MIDLIFCLLNLVICCVYCLALPNIPESLSATAYIYRKPWYFTIYCLITAVLLLVPWLNYSPPAYQFLVFFTCVGICFAGTTPFFKKPFEAPIHYGAGIVSLLCWMIWMFLVGNYSGLVWLGVGYYILIRIDGKNWVFYAETLALLHTIFFLLIHIIHNAI